MSDSRFEGRPTGRSSRLRPDPLAAERIWRSPGGIPVLLPVILDLVEIDAAGRLNWSFEATVGLRGNKPALVRMVIEAGESSPDGLDTLELQQHFRWNTPVEIVTRIVPRIIERGGDPFAFDYPQEGFPGVTQPRPGHRLTREFLIDVARDYLTAEAPYSQSLADRYNVTPRTIVSWIEKARKQGILEGGTKGRKDRNLQA